MISDLRFCPARGPDAAEAAADTAADEALGGDGAAIE